MSAVPTHNPDPYDLRLDSDPNVDCFGNRMDPNAQPQPRYSPAQLQALDDAVKNELASVSGGASTISQMLSGRFGPRAADIADALIQSVDAYGNELSAQEIAEDLAEQAALQHLPHADGNVEDSFASRQNPRGMEIAEEEDAANFLKPDQIGSARLDQQAVETFRAAYARAANQGKPEAEHKSFQEISDATEAAWQRQGMGRRDAIPDADPDAEGPGQGFVMDEDGIFRDQYQMAEDAAVRDAFSDAFNRAGRTLTQAEVETQEAAAGLDTRKLDRAHIDYCRKNLEG